MLPMLIIGTVICIGSLEVLVSKHDYMLALFFFTLIVAQYFYFPSPLSFGFLSLMIMLYTIHLNSNIKKENEIVTEQIPSRNRQMNQPDLIARNSPYVMEIYEKNKDYIRLGRSVGLILAIQEFMDKNNIKPDPKYTLVELRDKLMKLEEARSGVKK